MDQKDPQGQASTTEATSLDEGVSRAGAPAPPADPWTSLDVGVSRGEAPPPSGVPESPATVKYSPDRDREAMRGQIAMTLVWLLLLLCLSPVAVILFRGLCVWAATENELAAGACAGFPVIDLAELLQVLITPIVALVGAATGFYFGEKAGKG